MEWGPEAWVATYAAIVATGALALELRRWFESGPKIHVRARANMMMVNPANGETQSGFLLVDAVNRGELATTITAMAILEFPDRLTRWQNRPVQSFVVPMPFMYGAGQALPHVLEPGKMWNGLSEGNGPEVGDLERGTMWVAIYTTDRHKPYLALIPKRETRVELENAVEI